MAKETGTATDYINLLAKINTFLTTVATGWTNLRADIGAEAEYIWEGTAGKAPSAEITFGLKSYHDVADGYYNWEIRGMNGYAAGNSFETQPGASKPAYVPLQNTTISYWFWATDRRIFCVLKTGTNYQSFHAGFLNSFATDEDNQYPYPLLVAGCARLRNQKFTDNPQHYSSILNPSTDSTQTVGTTFNSLATGYVRMPDGAWLDVANFITNEYSNQQMTTGPGVRVSPRFRYNLDYVNEESSITAGTRTSFGGLFAATATGDTPATYLDQTENDAGDPITPLFPLTLVSHYPNPIPLGEIHGVYACTNRGGLVSEDTLTDTAPAPDDTYIFFQNVWRTDGWEYFAVLDE